MHAGNAQRSIAKISSFVYIDAGVDEGFGNWKITPSDNTMKSIIAVTGTCIYVRKVGVGKVARVAQLGNYSFQLIVYDQSLPCDPFVEKFCHRFQRLFRLRQLKVIPEGVG